MKIAFFEIKGWENNFLKKRLKGHSIKFYKELLSIKNVKDIRKFDIASIFIYSKIDKEIIRKLPKLKLIVTRSTGFDHMDLKECRRKKIVVCNIPFYGENTVAEHTFALILSLSRNIHKSYIRTLRNDFSIEGLKGFDIKEKTLGVIGAGHIGLHVIRIAKGFGMNVLTYDINQNRFLAEVLEERGFAGKTIDDAIEKAGKVIAPSLDDVKRAHEVRNSIVYNPEFRLTEETGKKTIEVYEKAINSIGL